MFEHNFAMSQYLTHKKGSVTSPDIPVYIMHGLSESGSRLHKE